MTESSTATAPVSSTEAAGVHADAIVVDIASATNPVMPTPVLDGEQVVRRALRGGVTMVNATVAAYGQGLRAALAEVVRLHRFLAQESDVALLVERVADIDEAKRSRRLGVGIFFQTGSPIEDDWLTTVPVLHAMGLRTTQLTYNETNLIGSGCLEPDDRGLTAYGRQVVSALNELGILIDVSHVGWRTARDAAAASTQPIIASHSNAYALTPHPRNLPDDLIKAIAATGGLVGVAVWEVICRPQSGDWPTLSDVVDHVDHIAGLVGVDHVGIGTDLNENFRALPTAPDFSVRYLRDPAAGPARQQTTSATGLEFYQDFPNLTAALLERGYAPDDVRKILGGNFVRVAGQVWG